MSRKRNFTRHNVNIAEWVVNPFGENKWVYSVQKGVVQPPKETDVYELTPSGTVWKETLEFYTQYDLDLEKTPLKFPVFFWGDEIPKRPNEGKRFEIIQQRGFVRFGRESYYKYIGYWNSDKDWGDDKPLYYDLSDDFPKAVESLEIAMDMKVSKVLP